VSVSAQEGEGEGEGETLQETLEEDLAEIDLGAWEKLLGEGALSDSLEGVGEWLKGWVSGEELSSEELFRAMLVRPLGDALKKGLRLMSVLAALSLTGALCTALAGDSGAGALIGRIVGGVTAVMAGAELYLLLSECRETMNGLVRFLEGAQPILAALSAAAGAEASSAVSLSMGTFFISVFSAFLLKAIYPAWAAVTMLQLAGLFASDGLLSEAGRWISRAAQWGLGFMTGCAVVVLKVQSGFSGSVDTITRRTLRVTFEQALPVVGSSLRDMVDSALISAGILQNGLGLAAMLLVAAVTVPLCVRLFVTHLSLRAGAIFAGKSDLAEGLRGVSQTVMLFLCCVVLCALMLLFTLAELVSQTRQVLGWL